MRVLLDPDLPAFAALARPVLATDPVRNTVPGTILRQHLDEGTPPHPQSRWIRVVDDTRADPPTVAVAMWTPPRPLLLAQMPVRAAGAVCDHLLAAGVTVPGVYGPQEVSGEFARRWSARTGVAPRVGFSSRLFRLDELTPPTGVPGEPRAATGADRDQLIAWTEAFGAEAIPDQETENAASMIDARLRRPGSIWMWFDEGDPVSMLWLNPPVDGVVRLSGVYTARDRRGRGYASACVAAASGRIRAEGNTCALFTDLANPTSNKIYQRIGFRPVMDARYWIFE